MRKETTIKMSRNFKDILNKNKKDGETFEDIIKRMAIKSKQIKLK